MRLVIDLQGAQGANRSRGIGRYALSFAQALARNRGSHEVYIALNGMFAETILPIRSAFRGILPAENIRAWNAVPPVAARDSANQWRHQAASIVRAGFLAQMKPDVIHISSHFEGFVDNAVTEIKVRNLLIPTTVSLFDLIPLLHSEHYLADPAMRSWYLAKVEELRRADLFLAISESSRHEAIDHLALDEDRAINVSCDADPMFQPALRSHPQRREVFEKFGIEREFVMYTGGIDFRKNVEGLIRSFGALPRRVRDRYQLAIVCAMDVGARLRLESLAREHGLGKNDLVLTGFVADAELITLYGCCALFVFPSWHEGFGLPVLEAMRCGAAVIGARASSVVEILEMEESLFEPRSDQAMTRSMAAALENETLRARLVENGRKRAKAFSWDDTAKCALAAMEALCPKVARNATERGRVVSRKARLAYVSPLPPLRTGIADYSAELLPELARHYEIDVIADQGEIADGWVTNQLPIRTVGWFRENAHLFDRVLYHFGNSDFHRFMFDLIEQVPGVTVMHDFFLSGVIAHRELLGDRPGFWLDALYRSHGYAAAVERLRGGDSSEVIWKYPCSFGVLVAGLGSIAHSSYSVDLARQWFNDRADHWAVVPLLRVADAMPDREVARKALAIDEHDILVCSFGMLGPTKLNHRLVEAWASSELARDSRCHLVFVGQNESGAYGANLIRSIAVSDGRQRIRITGWVEKDEFRTFLAAADIGVQLRVRSRGETSAAVLDCMNFGLATVANANGSQAELPRDAVFLLPDEFSTAELVDALEKLRSDFDLRRVLGNRAKQFVKDRHDPKYCAERYVDAIERFYSEAGNTPRGLAGAIGALNSQVPSGRDVLTLAKSVVHAFSQGERQLLVDVSEIVKRDGGSGIQRVVRNVLEEWLRSPPKGYRIEPVHAEVGRGYHYARRFTMEFLGCAPLLPDEPIDYTHGDVFVGLDLQPQVVPAHRQAYQEMRRSGVRVVFLVYDLLCISHPECFFPGASEGFKRWLEVVSESDTAVCISKSVADELRSWFVDRGLDNGADPTIGWFHLGSDFAAVKRSGNGVGGIKKTETGDERTFLMVGTIEPRKSHAQVLEAFEVLWREPNSRLRLLIVGREGWMMAPFIERLRNHPEMGRRLLWWHDCSDERLVDAYAQSCCLIAGSRGEGFGLPIVEAAQRGLPIIARDIPVFRELAGEHAHYFAGDDGQTLAQTISNWLDLDANNLVPSPEGIRLQSWRECAARLADLCIGGRSALAEDGREAMN